MPFFPQWPCQLQITHSKSSPISEKFIIKVNPDIVIADSELVIKGLVVVQFIMKIIKRIYKSYKNYIIRD